VINRLQLSFYSDLHAPHTKKYCIEVQMCSIPMKNNWPNVILALSLFVKFQHELSLNNQTG